MSRSSSLVAVVLALFAVACGPSGPLPGGPLTGTVHEGPVSDWSFSDRIQEAELETNPGDPYSVTVWCAQQGGALYVPTSLKRGDEHPGERQWVRNVTMDPKVRVKLGDTIYERRAVRVSEPAELEAVRAAFAKKYALDTGDLDPGREVWIFRLDPP